MAKAKHDELRHYAIRGAEQRLIELSQEVALIYQAFPELRARGTRRGVRPAADSSASSPARPRRGRRRRISADGRRRISEAQKARWARQRAERGRAAAASTGGKKR